jgi:HAD superfamily hydrolase (TIGR01509 family)
MKPDSVLAFPAGPIRAAIFDMDGVLLDSEPLHHQAINTLLAEEGHAGISEADYIGYLGTTTEYTWEDLVRRLGLEHSWQYYVERFDGPILEEYRLHSVISPGVIALLDVLQEKDVRLAVASSSQGTWVDACLLALDIRDRFEVVVAGDMVTTGKPDPAIYLLASRMLRVPPAECFAVEDSPKGIAAAVAAGMFTVAVQTPYTRGQATGAAQVHLRTLVEFDRSLVERVIGRARG